MSKFWDKYESPEWQKKRLVILQRDNFTCQACDSKTKQLHVDHVYYDSGKDPWDYPDEHLLTLCKDCHKEIGGLRKKICRLLRHANSYDHQFYMGIIAYRENYTWDARFIPRAVSDGVAYLHDHDENMFWKFVKQQTGQVDFDAACSACREQEYHEKEFEDVNREIELDALALNDAAMHEKIMTDPNDLNDRF